MNLEIRVDAYDVRKRAVQIRRRSINIEIIKVGVAACVIKTVGSVREVGSTDGNADVGCTRSLVGVGGYQVVEMYQFREERRVQAYTRSKR